MNNTNLEAIVMKKKKGGFKGDPEKGKYITEEVDNRIEDQIPYDMFPRDKDYVNILEDSLNILLEKSLRHLQLHLFDC